MTLVCGIDGVTVVENRSSRWVHIDELPDGTEPHDVGDVVAKEDWLEARLAKSDVRLLAHELIAHHIVMHPMSDCAFSRKLNDALRTR